MVVFSEKCGFLGLGPLVASGAEVSGYPVLGRSRLFATIYKPGAIPDHFEWWLGHVAASTKGIAGVVQNHGVLKDAPSGSCIGALWDKARGKIFADNPPTRKADRISYARQTIQTIQAMLDRGIIYSDIHAGNVFRTFWNRPVFIDMASISTTQELFHPDGAKRQRRFNRGALEYRPPELVAGSEHTAQTLAHSVAVHLWTIVKDEFPFALVDAHGNQLASEDILNAGCYGQFADHPDHLRPLDEGIPFLELSDSLRGLFVQAFRHGYKTPSLRPTIQDFADAFEVWERGEDRLRNFIVWGGAAGLTALMLAGALVMAPKTSVKKVPAKQVNDVKAVEPKPNPIWERK